MTASELLQAVRDAIANDNTLTAWCQGRFGRGPLVLLGMDEQKPPQASEYPVIAVTGVTESLGEGKREVVREVFVGIGIHQEEIQEETTGERTVRTATGLLQAEELRRLVENAVYRARIAGLESRAESGAEAFYPLFVSYTVLTFTDLLTTRHALPA